MIYCGSFPRGQILPRISLKETELCPYRSEVVLEHEPLLRCPWVPPKLLRNAGQNSFPSEDLKYSDYKVRGILFLFILLKFQWKLRQSSIESSESLPCQMSGQ
jgi:hypothetical protein